MFVEGCLQQAVHNSNTDLSAAVAENYYSEDFWAFSAWLEEAGLKTCLSVLMGQYSQAFVDELFEDNLLCFEIVIEEDKWVVRSGTVEDMKEE